jgi:hypothetical protein
MKLLIIFDKNIHISPEKVCIHVGHSSRHIGIKLTNNPLNWEFYNLWSRNDFKTVLLRDKITDSLKSKINDHFVYVIYDAGLDGVFAPGTVLGFAVIVPKSDETFKRLRTLKF